MPTKAELLQQLTDLHVEYQDFRKQVARRALKAARRHDWCDEVVRVLHRLGLQGEIPTTYSIQFTMRARWIDYATCLSSLRKARAHMHWEYRYDDPDPVRIVSVDGYGNLIEVHEECGPFGALL